ncbi:MAG: terpene cyclase/mutase family protein [Candidatus Pacebacteria bacterium]|nr:terpene cyclase/mutase family protein [Candidatus Paceibacterota bacterium]
MKFNKEQSIDFLLKNQEKNGSFLSLSSPSINNFKNTRKYHSVFPTSLILSSLSELDDLKSKKIISKGIKFLLTQKSDVWSFNYWVRNSEESKKLPYPDDLDDTFCAISTLFLNKPEIFDGEVLANIINILTFTEKQEGGPYKTWIVPSDTEEIWKDVDLVVNSNIAYFLLLQEISLPKLNKFIESKIDKEEYITPYYPTPYTAIYFISRYYKGKKVEKIKKYLFKKQNKNGSWNNPLNTALAVSALLNLGESPKKVDKAINYLNKNNENGKWKAYAFCIDPVINKKTYYAGSPTLTTAFCLEAMNKYKKVLEIKKTKIENKKTNDQKQIYNKIIKKTKNIFSKLDDDLKNQTLKSLEKINKHKSRFEIILLPYFFKSSLKKEFAKKLSDEMIINLGLANLLGWIAYTIYDDFLDEEGNPKKLSIANVCLRELTLIFEKILPYETGFFDFFKKTMNEIDSANTWETTNCRGIDLKNIPDYSNYKRLADRSMGHALGPTAILFSLGYKESSLEIKNTIKFFENYIITKQLNDDAHDWEIDLKNQHISPACALVLKKWTKNKELDIERDLEQLQSIFWNKTIIKLCNDVLKHSQKARMSIKKLKIINNFKIFEKILERQEKSAQKALDEQKKTLQFLKTFK